MVTRNDIWRYAYDNYNTSPAYLWEKSPSYGVLRHRSNNKWYAIIMDIPHNKVGGDTNALIDIMNLKCDPDMIASLVHQRGFAPAWHMNKTHWISVILDGTVPDDTIYQLLDMSYSITE